MTASIVYLDGSRDGRIIHQNHSVQQVPAQAEGLHANLMSTHQACVSCIPGLRMVPDRSCGPYMSAYLLDSYAVSKRINPRKYNPFATHQALGHGIRSRWLNANDLQSVAHRICASQAYQLAKVTR